MKGIACWTVLGTGVLLSVAHVAGQTCTELYAFTRGLDGATPRTTLVGSGSILFGATYFGSPTDSGTLFRINKDGTGYQQLRRFNSWTEPEGRPAGNLVLDETTLYGTTSSSGGIFKIQTDGSGYTVLKRFPGEVGEGAEPTGGLALSQGVLYGTTERGGSQNAGVIFKMNTDGTGYQTLKSFLRADGSNSQGALVIVGDVLYGTTYGGGAADAGVVFSIKTDGTAYRVLKEFGGSDGAHPRAGLAVGGDTLYGTTYEGGGRGMGSVFRLKMDGSGFQTLRSFNYDDGANPRGGLAVAGQRMFGTTYRGGTNGTGVVFKMNTDGSEFLLLAQMGAGGSPMAGVLVAGEGLYGTSGYGGSGAGDVFRVGMAPIFLEVPVSQTVVSGSDVDLVAQATGLPPLTYQWYYLQTPIPGTATNRLHFGNVQPARAGPYTVVVTNVMGAVTSPPAMLEVLLVPPRLDVAPTNQNVAVGGVAIFTAAASGSLPLSYQWLFNNQTLSGEKGQSLILTNVRPAHAGAYAARITNPVGTTSSPPAMLTMYGLPPTVVSGPTDVWVRAGETAEFAVELGGSPPFRRQWYFNGITPLPYATNTWLRVTNAQVEQSGSYAVRVTNDYGVVTSDSAQLVVRAAGTVMQCTENDLRMAMAQGGLVTFACDGVITLTTPIEVDRDTEMDGMGHAVTLSGGGGTRVFQVASNVSFGVSKLAIADGRSAGGSAVLNLGGRVTLWEVTLRSNTAAVSVPLEDIRPRGAGGAFRNRGGTVMATNCVFEGNVSMSPTPTDFDVDPLASGGAVENELGNMRFHNCTFVGNRAIGGSSIHPSMWPGTGYPAYGGAIHNSGTLEIQLCKLLGNAVVGGSASGDPTGNPGAEGSGGAVCNEGTLSAADTAFVGNTVRGGGGGQGYAVSYPNDLNGYPGGAGGSALGGAITDLGTAHIARCLFASNSVNGGTGGKGGDAVQIMDIGGSGGDGGDGGWGMGGAVQGNSATVLTDCTVAFNSGWGGNGGAGGTGRGWVNPGKNGAPGDSGLGCGGLVGDWNSTNCTVAWNTGTTGSKGVSGAGQLINALVASNTPLGGDSFSEPRLGPLADNGGPTWTMALLPGSPAIDAANTAGAGAIDQRGFPRPCGPAADLGAYEYQYPLMLKANLGQAGGIDIEVWGLPGQGCALLETTDFREWRVVASGDIGEDGRLIFHREAAEEVRGFRAREEGER